MTPKDVTGTTVGENAWRALLGLSGAAVGFLLIMLLAGLVGGLGWWLFRLAWGWFV